MLLNTTIWEEVIEFKYILGMLLDIHSTDFFVFQNDKVASTQNSVWSDPQSAHYCEFLLFCLKMTPCLFLLFTWRQ